MRIRLLCIFSVLLLASLSSISTFAADAPQLGVPYIQNFSKNLYAAANQNWAIAKDKNGVVYFGNSGGLLSYDGKYWLKHELPNKQIIRAVAVGNNNLVYTGGFEEFGYWKFENKKLHYTSLVNLLPKSFKFNSEIWKIHNIGNKIYFQAFTHLFIYEGGKITIIKPNNNLLFTHKVGNKLFAEVIDGGLFEIIDKKFLKLAGSEVLGQTGILTILPFKDNQLLIGTGKNGLFIFDGTNFKIFNNQANAFLKTYQINNGFRLDNNHYAFGTILNGIIVIDDNGNIVQRLNKTNGLQNNTVLSLFKDNEDNLWAGLDNGIDRIELNSPLSFYFDKNGKFGTVYSSVIVGKNIYLGTNQGLFYGNWNANALNQPNFTLIQNSQGQVWDLTIINGQLFCGHNNGTFKIVGDKLEKISNINGGWTIKVLKSNPNFLVQGTYTGLAIYKKDNSGQWLLSHRVDGFGEPSRYVEQDHNGNIWASHAYKGLYRITLSEDLRRATNVQYYDQKNGLPSNFNINTFNLENKVVFSSDVGFYVFDDIANKFSKYQDLNVKLGTFARANKIISAGDKKYWFIKQGSISLADFNSAGKIKIDSSKLNILDGRMAQYYENISNISQNRYLISIDDGYAIYDLKLASQKTNTKLPKVVISRIEDITDRYHIISERGVNNESIEIPFTRNSLRISFALPYYRLSKIKYQYFLEGYSKQWSEWSATTQKDFTNLAHGKYTFKVRSKIDDVALSQISEVHINILPPWYASNLALFIYLLCLAVALIIGKKIYERKLDKDQQKIKDKIREEHDTLLKKEAEENEKQIHRLETEKLHTELAGKSRELANSAMNLVYKNELLQKISLELNKLKENHEQRNNDDQLRKINKIIDDAMNDERDWNLFENSFNEAHENFFKKLKVDHPDLVPNDLKLCAYLRMNMSSKEMASLLNISVRGVEIRRYRLRKKLSVPHDRNLTEFLIEL